MTNSISTDALTGGLHVHLPAGQPATLHFDPKTGTVTLETTPAEGAAPPSTPPTPLEVAPIDLAWSPGVEDLLMRHHAYQKESRSRELVTGLVERGWKAYQPNKGTYVRCVYYGDAHETPMYVRSETIILKGKLRELCIDMPGAAAASNDVHFRHSGADSSWENTWAAIDAVEAYANGQ